MPRRRGGAQADFAEFNPMEARLVKLEQTREREFDRLYWQGQPMAARFEAAWDLVRLYLTMRGREGEQRLQRSVAVLKQLPG